MSLLLSWHGEIQMDKEIGKIKWQQQKGSI